MRPLLTLMASALVACATSAGNGDDPPHTRSAADTLHGRVTVVGSDPATFLSLQPADGGRAITLEGAGAEALRSVSGAEVRVAGTGTATGFVVDGFTVTRVNDRPVLDGFVVMPGTDIAVLTPNGMVDFPYATAQLVALLGRRVWITRPAVGQAPSFGEIRAPQ